jgi:hypothetical protein
VIVREKPDLHCFAKFEFFAGNLNLTALKIYRWKFRLHALSCTILLNALPLTNRKPSPENHVKIAVVYYSSGSPRRL